MKNPAMLIPGAIEALQAAAGLSKTAGVPERTLGLVHMRVSQINGCAVCLEGHRSIAGKLDESEQRTFAVAVWRDAPFFDDAERAALALAEAVTLLSERGVPDEVWSEAARRFDERALAALILHIAMVNVWNRLNVSTRQVAGEVKWG